MAMRITTSMVQRNILSDLNNISSKLTKTQMKAASNKEISRPSDDPFGTAQAMALRQSLSANRQHQSTVEDSIGWQNATEQALMDITDAVEKAKNLLVQGGNESFDQTSRDAIASELEQLIEGIKQTANTSYRGTWAPGLGTDIGLTLYDSTPEEVKCSQTEGPGPAGAGAGRVAGRS